MGDIVEIIRAQPGGRFDIFTSGGTIRAAIIGAMEYPPDRRARRSTWNPGVSRLECRDNVWKLTGFNDVSLLCGTVGGASGRPTADVAAWILNPERFRPGTAMPTFAGRLSEAEALALADWVRRKPTATRPL